MTTFEQTLLQEVSSLPASRRAAVLAFVRYLKISLGDDETLEQEYGAALKEARKTAKKYNITPAVIEDEIRAVREGK
jgi:hypothetical protein